MPTTYITKQGETIDLACYRHYGRTADVTELVLAANPALAASDAVLPMGTRILMPDAPPSPAARPLVSLWT
ncbi:tail protein X [Shinella sp. NM-101]|uniref:tail protein X n=1 Tax=Shinella sp. NM-101 TaxID=2744455 RepID=UPI001F430EC1|nr:tail protein X [Shinella sp. NM-101]